MATINYSCTEARYRQNAGTWWVPLSSVRTPTGWNADGSNKYETRYAFDFDAIRAKNVTDSMVSAKLHFRQTNQYNQKTVYGRVTTSAYADIAAGSTGLSVVNGWSSITFSAAMRAALVHATAVYVGTYGVANGTYIEIYGTGSYAVYLEIEWTPREPSPTVPTLDSISTITTDSRTFNWSDASDTSNIFTSSQLYYEMQLSVDNGSKWAAAVTSTQGSSQYTLNLRTALSLLAGQYYYNATCKIRVRTKTPNYEGSPYYSAYATSPAFAINYRITPTAPPTLTPSKSNPYEGEEITFTVGRPASYNAYDSAGDAMVLDYYVKLQSGTTLVHGTAAVSSATKVLTYTVGNLTSGVSDLSTYLKANVVDAESQTGAYLENQAWTVKRFRAPSVIVTTIDREETSATVNILVTDTGYGGAQNKEQITKIEYSLAGGGWTEATLVGWSGLYNSFGVTGLDAATRYTLQLRATNDAPAGTALSDKTGSTYTGTILERIPASAPYKNTVTGVSGHFAKTLIIGNDPAESVDAGSAVIQNDLTLGGDLIGPAGVGLAIAWTAVTFENSWVNLGSGYENVKYCKDVAGWVHLRGSMKTGTIPAVAFTLPTGCRPVTAAEAFPVISAWAIGAVYITTDGAVHVQAGSATSLSVSGISFYVG